MNQFIIIQPHELQSLIKEAVSEAMQSQQPTAQEQPIRGIKGLAKYLGISAVTAQKLKNEGKVPFWQSERVLLFDPNEVLKALKTK